jgi:hypothetical protein
MEVTESVKQAELTEVLIEVYSTGPWSSDNLPEESKGSWERA